MNYVLLSFSFLTSVIIFGCSLVIVLEHKLHPFLVKNFKYGKFGIKDKSTGRLSNLTIEVPKSWFRHYYAFAIIIFSYTFYMVTCTYVFNYEVPQWFITLLNITCGQNRVATTSTTKTYLSLCLLTLQVFRRFYDTHFMSVFKKSGRMNLSHYLVGLYHYPGCVLAILSEAPKFASESLTPLGSTFSIANISKVEIGVVIIFLWAWWHQHVTTKILANLRKNEKGVVVCEEHKVPYGDWFKYFTAPHQIAEIIMYISLTVLLWTNFTWFFVFTWVLSNQVETIIMTHLWYKEKFEDFPKERNALIPFVY